MDQNTIKLFGSKKTDNWQTPKEILDNLENEFGKLYDPCPLNPVEDGLLVDWKETTFVNPPYSKVKQFLNKAWEELHKGHCKTIIFLTFANTDTNWFHQYCLNKGDKIITPEIRFIKGRLKFRNQDGEIQSSAMRPSILIIFKSGAESECDK